LNLSDILNITRAGPAGYFDSTGTYKQATANVAREDYDPATIVAQNAIRNSAAAGAVAGTPGTAPTNWTFVVPSGLTGTVVGTGTENGTPYVEYRWAGTVNAAGQILIAYFESGAGSPAASSGQTWTNSASVRLTGGSLAGVNMVIGMDELDAGNALLVGGTVAFAPSAAALGTSRPAYTRTLTNASTAKVRPYVYSALANGATIDITLRIGLPQLEQGSVARAPIATTGTAYKLCAKRGLLVEEPRTNLLTWSEQFDNAVWVKTATVTANQAIAPDGTATADQLASTGADQLVEQIASATAGIAYTFTVWVKTVSVATTLDIKLAKNSDGAAFASQSITTTGTWQRVTLTGTAPVGETAIRARIGGGSTFSTGETLYVWGAQLEAGAAASSYIPTTLAAIARPGDAIAFKSMSPFKMTEGTFFAEFMQNSTAASQYIFALSDGTASNCIAAFRAGGGAIQPRITIGGTAYDPTASAPIAAGATVKIAMRVKPGDSALAVNGQVYASSAPPSLPTVTQAEIGALVAATFMNGWLRRFSFTPQGAANADLVSMTA
jgi:hypothetical protein